MKEFINLSGGLNKFADNQSITIIHPNGEAVRAKYSFFANSKYKLYAGSVIYVPRDLSYIDGIDLAAPLSQIFSSLAISLASINSLLYELIETASIADCFLSMASLYDFLNSL